MKRHSWNEAMTLIAVSGGILLIASACERSPQPSADTSTAVSAPATPSESATLRPPDNGLRATPEQDAGQTREYIRSLSWDTSSTAVYNGPLTVRGSEFNVKISPAVSANSVDWQNAVATGPNPQYTGHFVLKVESTAPIPGFGMNDPGDVGYLWIGRTLQGGQDRPMLAMYVLRQDSTIRRRTDVRLAKARWCPSTHAGPKVEVRPFPCQGSVPFEVPLTAEAAKDTILLEPGLGLWVTCRGGCCQVQTT